LKRFIHIIGVIFRRIKSLIIIENIYLLKQDKEITDLQVINKKYQIRTITENDIQELKRISNYRKETCFEDEMLPRLKNKNWVGLATIDTTNREIAYLAWVVKKNVDFINEMKIKLKSNQIFIKDGYCVPKYRHQFIHQRMMQERINFCIRNGANEIFVGILNANKKGIQNVTEFGFELFQKNFLFKIKVKKIFYSKSIINNY